MRSGQWGPATQVSKDDEQYKKDQTEAKQSRAREQLEEQRRRAKLQKHARAGQGYLDGVRRVFIRMYQTLLLSSVFLFKTCFHRCSSAAQGQPPSPPRSAQPRTAPRQR